MPIGNKSHGKGGWEDINSEVAVVSPEMRKVSFALDSDLMMTYLQI